MDYTVKLAYQSNYWYNDGLAKAQVRDMSGAITSLKKSLQYNRANLGFCQSVIVPVIRLVR